ncbi:MAG: hypothetical protein LBG65_08170 [Puniceicoccales bacterium]|jgi:hypothetical protein|nr:hypothetical protein [Puniceicoccales bacterium]
MSVEELINAPSAYRTAEPSFSQSHGQSQLGNPGKPEELEVELLPELDELELLEELEH